MFFGSLSPLDHPRDCRSFPFALEDLVEELTRGNVTEVKVVLASVVAALAVYQVLLMAVGYGKLRPPFLGAAPASAAHRALGDAIVVVTLELGPTSVAELEAEEERRDARIERAEERRELQEERRDR